MTMEPRRKPEGLQKPSLPPPPSSQASGRRASVWPRNLLSRCPEQ